MGLDLGCTLSLSLLHTHVSLVSSPTHTEVKVIFWKVCLRPEYLHHQTLAPLEITVATASRGNSPFAGLS